jgi:hypothetical protein
MATPKYWMPTRPYSVIDAVNRMAAATGSTAYAMRAAHADYNGHAVRVYWNDYRGYWLAEYQWGERVVLARGQLAEALYAACREYKRGALGASVRAAYPESVREGNVPSESIPYFEQMCVEHGLTSEAVLSEEAHRDTWWTPLHAKVNEALDYERRGFAPAVGFLCNSATLDEYEAKLNAHFAARRRG